jgi:hypothetical protein
MQKRALRQVELLIDSGCISNKYVILDEVLANDSNSIYSIADHKAPYTPLDMVPPFKIIPYSGKYVCIIGLREEGIPIAKVNKLTNYSGNPMELVGRAKWLLGVSKYSNITSLLEDCQPDEYNDIEIYDRPQLWPYYSGYEGQSHSLLVFMLSHNTTVSLKDRWKTADVDNIRTDMMKNNILGLAGELYFTNNTDSLITILPRGNQYSLAILNARDTLFLHLKDSTDILLKPKERKIVKFESELNHMFFSNLPKDTPWESLYSIIRDSSFIFMNRDGKKGRKRIIHNDRFELFGIIDKECNHDLFWVVNKGIRDRNVQMEKTFKYYNRIINP